MTEIVNVGESLVWYIVFTVVIAVSIYMLPRLKWEVRRLPALDAIDEGIRSCVERGKAVHFTPGGASPTGSMTFSQTLPASLEVWRYSVRTSSELNVQVLGSCEIAATQLMMQDYARQAFIESGHPERYDPSIVYYFPAREGGPYGMIGLLHRENIGLHLSWGVFGGGSHLPGVAVANQVEAITVACNAYPMETAECALGADYPVIMEEEMASGVYLSRDPVQIASLLGEDFLKILLSIFLIVASLLFVMGRIGHYAPTRWA